MTKAEKIRWEREARLAREVDRLLPEYGRAVPVGAILRRINRGMSAPARFCTAHALAQFAREAGLSVERRCATLGRRRDQFVCVLVDGELERFIVACMPDEKLAPEPVLTLDEQAGEDLGGIPATLDTRGFIEFEPVGDPIFAEGGGMSGVRKHDALR